MKYTLSEKNYLAKEPILSEVLGAVERSIVSGDTVAMMQAYHALEALE